MKNERIYGYVRVSSQSQNEDRQMRALLEFGVEEDKIICDKKSGKDLERDGYLFLKHHILRPGDTLVIKELDRQRISKKNWNISIRTIFGSKSWIYQPHCLIFRKNRNG